MDDSDFKEPPANKTTLCFTSPVLPSKMDTICWGYIPPNTKKATSWVERAFEQWRDQQNEKSKFAARYDLLTFSISHILENKCIAQDILENINTTQDALSGTGYNVYSFVLMFRPPGLQIIIYAEKVSMCEYWISTFITPCTSAHVLWLTADSGTPSSSIAGQGEQGSQTASFLIF